MKLCSEHACPVNTAQQRHKFKRPSRIAAPAAREEIPNPLIGILQSEQRTEGPGKLETNQGRARLIGVD
jgi:hypothetical protein